MGGHVDKVQALVSIWRWWSAWSFFRFYPRAPGTQRV